MRAALAAELVWLNGPVALTILNAMLDRLDKAQKSGAASAAPVLLEKAFPEIFAAAFESDKEEFFEQVKMLADIGWLSLKLDKRKPGHAGYELNPRVAIADESAVRAHLHRLARALSYAEVWRDAVLRGLIASEDGLTCACRFVIEIDGHTPDEIVTRLNVLHELNGQPLLLREVAARLFWGMSKVLDKREAMVSAILGTGECPFPQAPVMLQAYLPADGFDSVLFIENQTTFETAVRSKLPAFDRLALVFGAGFRAGAKRLRMFNGFSLYFSANGDLARPAISKFEDWLAGASDMPSFFWGDLDYSGLHILKALRDVFENTQAWIPGYSPMLAALSVGDHHSPLAADKGGQAPLSRTGCSFADAILLPTVTEAQGFVDQESVDFPAAFGRHDGSRGLGVLG